MSEGKFSFSKLDSFHNCKRSYYYTYILHNRSGDNIYSFLGTIVHELVEKLEQDLITKEQSVDEFIDAVDDADMLGLEWISDKVKTNFVDCITHYLENFKHQKYDEIHIEDYFEVDILDITIRGYIDKWYRIGDDIFIMDYKTSSKFSAKDLLKKQRQLLIYARALEDKYPKCNIYLCFNMLKYAYQNGKLTERNKLNILEDFEDGIIKIKYTSELKSDLDEYVSETTTEIDGLDQTKKYQWSMSYNPHVDFFCKNLCGYRDKCLNCE